MILRIWRGWTRLADEEAYADYVKSTGIAAYQATRGNRGAWVVSRRDGDRAEFLTLSMWDDMESIAAFAGEEVARAVFYPEDDNYLVDRETFVRHYVVR